MKDWDEGGIENMTIKELINTLKHLDQSKPIFMHELGEGYFDVEIVPDGDDENYFIENGAEIVFDEE